MSAGKNPEFVIVSDDPSEESTVHTAVTDKSGIQKLLTLSEVSSLQKELPTEPTPKKPKKKIQKTEKIPCGLCNKSFVSEKSVERHKKTVHSNEEETGSIEDPSKPSTSEKNRQNILLKDHNVVASLSKELQNLTTRKETKNSKKTIKKHLCVECGKTFVTPSMLRRHLVVHSGEKPYECLVCGNRYSQSERLKRHMGNHTGLNLFTCKACGKRFPEKCRYIDHVRAHLEVKPFECDVCEKSFSNRVSLWKHKSVHTGDKRYYGTSCCAYRYKCEECGKEFRQKQDLIRHNRTHTGETPEKTLICSFCSKGFSRKTLLDTHLRSHTGERPFSCPFCLRAFACKRSLAHHIKLHKSGGQTVLAKSEDDVRETSPFNSKAPEYKCNQCGAICVNEAALFWHVENKHQVKKELPVQNENIACKSSRESTNSTVNTSFSLLRSQLSTPPQIFAQSRTTNMEPVQYTKSQDIDTDSVTVSENNVNKLYFLINSSNSDSFSRVTPEELNALSITLPHVSFCSHDGTRLPGLSPGEGYNPPLMLNPVTETEPASQTISSTSTTTNKYCQNDSTVSTEGFETSNKSVTKSTSLMKLLPVSTTTAYECDKVDWKVSIEKRVTKANFPLLENCPAHTDSSVGTSTVISYSDLSIHQALPTDTVVSNILLNDGSKIVFKILQQPIQNAAEEVTGSISSTPVNPSEVNVCAQSCNNNTTSGVSCSLTEIRATEKQVTYPLTFPKSENKSTFHENQMRSDNAPNLCEQTDKKDVYMLPVTKCEEFPDRTSTFASVELLNEFMPQKRKRRRSV